jgi:hypothetical protein
MARRPKYTLDITASANGRVGRATVKALDGERNVITADKADLNDAKDREKLTGRMARKLGYTNKQGVAHFARTLETAWNRVLTDHQRAIDEAAAGCSPPPAVPAPPPYLVEQGRTCRQHRTPDGAAAVTPLCNFDARIVEQITTDDGVERSTSFALEGRHADGRTLPRVTVPAKDFPHLNWVVEHWGTSAIVCAGQGVRDHLRCAIQTFSENVAVRTLYSHTGWRKIGEHWVYLHAGGAIGEAGPVEGIETALPTPLQRFQLPDPPEGEDLREALRASLRLLDGLAPDHTSFIVLAAPFRAALGDTDHSVHHEGPSGHFKTEIAALSQQFFGAGLDARHLPANWSSTGNALEGIVFAAKDALVVIDDFAPTGSSGDVQRYHREADRMLRAQGNHAGRMRMRADTTLRPEKPPRGLPVSTGEDTPRGQSLRARVLVNEVSPGDINRDRLTECQRDAAEGKYALTLAAFVRWLAPRYEEVRARLKQEQADLRERARADGQHARTPGIFASLALGLRYFLDFAKDVGALGDEEAHDFWTRGFAALAEAAAHSSHCVTAAEPTRLFLQLLTGAIASGRAHVAGVTGNAPDSPQSWGWRRENFGNNPPSWKEQGKRIGWLDGDSLYLEPTAAFAAAQEIGNVTGEGLAIGSRTLATRLREANLLAQVYRSGDKVRNTVVRVVEGQSRHVLCLRADSLTLYSSVKSAKFGGNTGENDASGMRTGENTECQECQECQVGECAAHGENGQTCHSSHSGTGGESSRGADAQDPFADFTPL